MASFLPPTVRTMENALNAATMRQRVIANNIANAETPGFKAERVEFEKFLQEALNPAPTHFVGRRTDPRHLEIGPQPELPAVTAGLYKDTTTWGKNNGNNVDVEYEMSKMAENQIWYNALVQGVSGTFTKLREVIKEGR